MLLLLFWSTDMWQQTLWVPYLVIFVPNDGGTSGTNRITWLQLLGDDTKTILRIEFRIFNQIFTKNFRNMLRFSSAITSEGYTGLIGYWKVKTKTWIHNKSRNMIWKNSMFLIVLDILISKVKCFFPKKHLLSFCPMLVDDNDEMPIANWKALGILNSFLSLLRKNFLRIF